MAVKSVQDAIKATHLNSLQDGRGSDRDGHHVNCAPVVRCSGADCHAFLAASRTYGADADMIGKAGRGGFAAVCWKGASRPLSSTSPDMDGRKWTAISPCR